MAAPTSSHHGEVTAVPETPRDCARSIDERITTAHRLAMAGDPEPAAAVVADTIRAGLWQETRLWSELWALMWEPGDYQRIRSLWLQSPRACQRSVPVLRPVARAASAAGEHGEARLLLRRAILLRSRQSRRPRARLGRLKHRLAARLRPGNGFPQRAGVALADLNRVLDRMGLRAFLISGTLLGSVRESGFIAWDKDIDLGILADGLPPDWARETFTAQDPFLVRRLDFGSSRLRVDHRTGVMIDLFPHYRQGGKVWHDGSATRWWNTPFTLREAEFLGNPQWLPDDPERYLTENYGDWRTPDPMFDARLDAPNVAVTDHEFLDTLLYFSLLDAVGRRHRRKQARYTALLRERGEGAWLSRL